MMWSPTGTLRTSVCSSMICSPLSTAFGDLVELRAGGAAGDLELLVERRVVHEHLEHEAVLLGFGQRVRPLLFDRVLGGEHEERVAQLVSHPADGDLPLLHGFEQRACVLGGVRLISSASTTLANSGPWRKRNSRRPVLRFSSITSVPVMSDGIRSGVNWMRLEVEGEALREGADHERLGEAGHPFEHAVPAAEHGDEQLLDHLVLADDHLRHLAADLVERPLQLLHCVHVGRGQFAVPGVPGLRHRVGVGHAAGGGGVLVAHRGSLAGRGWVVGNATAGRRAPAPSPTA